MILDLMADALTWLLAVCALMLGLWFVFLGLAFAHRLARPSYDMLAWYGNRTVRWYRALNISVVGSPVMPLGSLLVGVGVVLYVVSWMVNKSGLAGLIADGKLLNLLSLMPLDKVYFVALVVAFVLAFAMAMNARRRGFVETKLAGYATMMAAAWLLFFCFFDSSAAIDFKEFGLLREPLWVDVVGSKRANYVPVRGAMDGIGGFLGGACMAGLIGVTVAIGMMLCGFLAAIFNLLLVGLFSRSLFSVVFSFTWLGAAVFLAIRWAN